MDDDWSQYFRDVTPIPAPVSPPPVEGEAPSPAKAAPLCSGKLDPNFEAPPSEVAIAADDSKDDAPSPSLAGRGRLSPSLMPSKYQ